MPYTYSEARVRANKKWMEKAYDRMTVTMPKGKRQEIQAAAQAAGLSVNAWIARLIEKELEKAESDPVR